MSWIRYPNKGEGTNFGYMITLRHGHAYTMTGFFFQWYPVATVGFPSPRTCSADLWRFRWCYLNKPLKKESIGRRLKKLIWCHYNGWKIYRRKRMAIIGHRPPLCNYVRNFYIVLGGLGVHPERESREALHLCGKLLIKYRFDGPSYILGVNWVKFYCRL